MKVLANVLAVAAVMAVAGGVYAQVAATQAAMPPTKENYLKVWGEVEKSLREDDLQKFYPASVDPAGGFFESFNEAWVHRATGDTTRSVVYQARLTWLAAQAAERYPAQKEEYLKFSKHGADWLMTKQWDKEKGGFWWNVNVTTGQPVSADSKHVYGVAFGIYALAAYYQASHDAAALEAAKQGFAWLESHAHDAVNGGYFEQLRADGSHVTAGGAGGGRGGDVLGARPGQKSMNAHIHLLEALTGLLEVWPDELVKKRTEEVYQISLTKICAEPGYLHLFFSEDWTPVEGRDSYGHDIETAFLFAEAAKALGKPDDPKCWEMGKKIVDHCLKVGFDQTSGTLNNEGTVDGSGTADKARVWWVQAESLNALLLMHERYGKDDSKYWDAFVKQWQYINTYQIDHKNGGWYSQVNADNTPARQKAAKTDAWTEGYHQGRSMLSVTERLKRLAGG